MTASLSSLTSAPLLARAHDALALGDIPGALDYFTAAARTDPSGVDAHHGRAECLRLVGRKAEAKSSALKCLSLAPTHVPVLTLLAELTFEMGEERGLRQVLETLRVLDQNGIAGAGAALLELKQSCRATLMLRNARGAFDAFVSLGNNCEPAVQMVRHGYDEGSFFRYSLSSTDEVCRLVLTDFAGVYQKENLVPCSDNMVRDVLTGVSLHSDLRSQIDPATGERRFRTDYDFDAIYRREREKIGYLIEKWRRLTASDARVLYIRKHDGSDPRPPEGAPHEGGRGRVRAQVLSDALRTKYPNHDFTLLFLQTDDERQNDWGLPRVVNRYFTRFASRHAIHDGQIAEWDQLFADFPLLPEWLQLRA